MKLIVAAALLTASPAAAFNLGGSRSSPPPAASRSVQPAAGPPPLASERNALEDAWDRFVLLRPADKQIGEGWWGSRTPGTARTILISSFICVVIAVPVLGTNPVVLSWLLELAALDRLGVTPMEMLERTGGFWVNPWD